MPPKTKKDDEKPTPQYILDANPKPPNETSEEEKKRLGRIRSAKYRYYKQLKDSSQIKTPAESSLVSQVLQASQASQVESSAGSSSQVELSAEFSSQVESISQIESTLQVESQTELQAESILIISKSRTKTQEATRLRMQKYRLSKNDKEIEEDRRKSRERQRKRYEKIKKKVFNQFLKIGCCDLDIYMEENIEGENIENGRQKFEKMNIICKHCYVLKWRNETKGFCCLNRQIQLASLTPVPEILYKLLITEDPNTNKSFVNQIKAYNQIFAFT